MNALAKLTEGIATQFLESIDTPYTQIEFQHLQEWHESGVDTEIIHLNVKSLEGTTPYEYLIYSPKISRRNDGRLRDGDLKKYRHIEHGGWWCSGVDPLDDYNPMMWGCFKPDRPRRDKNKIYKYIKYEHPYKEPTRAFFLEVPHRIWMKIARNCGITITPEDLQKNQGFWYWVWKNNVPIVIVEGAKKAACLLTAGYAAIAIPGINAGYRLPKDDDGNTIGKPFLIPDLKHFATPNRRIDICFDRDRNGFCFRCGQWIDAYIFKCWIDFAEVWHCWIANNQCIVSIP